jgi:hypothetical protein
MKFLFCVALLSITASNAFAQGGRDAVEACMTKCSNDDASCRRVCPVTFNGPCLSSCDSRVQSCRQTCQSR